MYAVAGAVAGVISGMGMGGGTVLIPILTLLLGASQTDAATVNLIAFLPASCVAAFIHAKGDRLKWNLVKPFLIPGLMGALLGTGAAAFLPEALLKKAFGVFLILTAIIQWRAAEKRAKCPPK